MCVCVCVRARARAEFRVRLRILPFPDFTQRRLVVSQLFGTNFGSHLKGSSIPLQMGRICSTETSANTNLSYVKFQKSEDVICAAAEA